MNEPSHRPRGGAVIALTLVLGVVAGFLAGQPPSLRHAVFGAETGESDPDAWREVFARQFSHTTSQTLLALPQNEAGNLARLAALSRETRLDLTRERVDLTRQVLARVDYFFFNNERFGQIVYVDEENGAVALFILRREGSPADLASEARGGVNIVSWATASHRFMVTGGATIEELTRMANALRRQLGP